MAQLIDTMIVHQDVGTLEPHYKLAKLQFWDNGLVTWEEPTEEEEGNHFWQTWIKKEKQ